MTGDAENLPYRLNVGAAVFNRQGLVFAGRRADQTAATAQAWQMPQGGIDAGEDPAEAVFRELEEEIGTRNVRLLARHPEWLTYDLPPDLRAAAFGGRYRGQRQAWFALAFDGDDSEIRLDTHTHPEFVEWRWLKLQDLPALAVPFKRQVYEVIARDFADFAKVRG